MGFIAKTWLRKDIHGRSQTCTARRCHFELMEPRQLLAADLAGGAIDHAYGVTGGATGSISGSVFATQAATNCEAHLAQSSLAGVRVQLLSDTGTVLEESLTDAQGAYHFADLLPGHYALRQESLAGFANGASHVGSGSGVELGQNQVSEIIVQAGENLIDYNFCEIAADVDIDAAADSATTAVLSLSLQSDSLEQPEVTTELAPVSTDEKAAEQQPLQTRPRRFEIYGGSSQRLDGPEGVKAWDEDPFDNWFSTASYWELASANVSALDALEKSLAGEEVIQLASDSSQVDVPKVANRPEKPPVQKQPNPTANQEQDLADPIPGRTVDQERAEAVDQALTYDSPAVEDEAGTQTVELQQAS